MSSVPSVRSVRSVSCDENIDVTGIPHGTKRIWTQRGHQMTQMTQMTQITQITQIS